MTKFISHIEQYSDFWIQTQKEKIMSLPKRSRVKSYKMINTLLCFLSTQPEKPEKDSIWIDNTHKCNIQYNATLKWSNIDCPQALMAEQNSLLPSPLINPKFSWTFSKSSSFRLALFFLSVNTQKAKIRRNGKRIVITNAEEIKLVIVIDPSSPLFLWSEWILLQSLFQKSSAGLTQIYLFFLPSFLSQMCNSMGLKILTDCTIENRAH